MAAGWRRSLQRALWLPALATLAMGFVRRTMRSVLRLYWALAVGLVLVVAWHATPTRDANFYNALPLLIIGLSLLELDPEARTVQNPVLLVAVIGTLFALTFSLGALQCRFAIAPLRGVASQCSRVGPVEGVVRAIAENSAPGDAIFVAQNSPALYVLAQRAVWGNSPWPYLDSTHDIARWFAEADSSPRLLVLDKINLVGGRDWPNSDNGELRQHVSGLKRHWPIYTAYLTTHNYRLIFENALWQVYARDEVK